MSSVRDMLRSANDPRGYHQPYKAANPGLAGPIEIIGQGTQPDLVFLSELARSLSSREAAQINAPPSPMALPEPASRFDESA